MTDIARLGMDIDSAGLLEGQRQLQNLVSAGANAEKQTEKQANKIGTNWSAIATKAGAAIAAVGTGVTLALRGQLNSIDALAKDSQRIGIPIEHLSQLKHAAELSGVSMGNVQTALQRLSQNMANDSEKFQELGISVRDATGAMRPTVDVMEDFADVLAAMPDGAEKTALAVDLMGRSGAALIPMFNGGAEALRAMREEADRFGLTISDDTAQAAQNFNDNITRLTATGKGFWLMITAELAPTLEKFSAILVDLIGRFNGLSPRMRSLISNGALITAAITPLIAVVGAFVAAIALVGAPVLAAGAAVAAVSALLVTFWDDIVAAGVAVKDFALGIGTWFIESFNNLFLWFTSIPERFIEFGRSIIDGIGSGINEAWESVKESIKEKIDWLPDWVKRRLGIASPSKVFEEIGVNIGDGLALGIQSSGSLAVSAVQSIGGQLVGSAFGTAKGVVDAMGQMFQGSKPIAMAQALINTYQGITEALKLPFPASLAAAARVAAQGFAAVAGINSARPGSTGNIAPASTTSQSQAPSQPTQPEQPQQQQAPAMSGTLTVEGVSPNSLFTGDAVRQLADQLLDYQRSGGRVVWA